MFDVHCGEMSGARVLSPRGCLLAGNSEGAEGDALRADTADVQDGCLCPGLLVRRTRLLESGRRIGSVKSKTIRAQQRHFSSRHKVTVNLDCAAQRHFATKVEARSSSIFSPLPVRLGLRPPC